MVGGFFFFFLITKIPIHLTTPNMYASKPTRNSSKTAFLIFRAFSLEGSKSRSAEQTIRPTSVTKTKGMNHTPTKPRSQVNGVNATADK